MTTLRYRTSSHGISKRFRLNNEQSETIIQEIDEILLPVGRKDLQDIESINEFSYRSDILSISDKLKDLHNCVINSCIGVSTNPSSDKCLLVKVYNETEEKVVNSKETDQSLMKQTSNLKNDQSLKDFNLPNATFFNTVDHQAKREPLRTLSQTHQHASLKDNTEFSIDSTNSDLSYMPNLKESTKSNEVAVEKNKLDAYEDNRINKLSIIDKLKTIQPEECDKTVRISEDIGNATEFHNDGGIPLEKSNNLSLKVIGDSLDSLKTKQLDEENLLKECHHSVVNSARNSEKSVSENVNIWEVSKQENNKTKSDLYYSNAYKMFSNVIQKARNKVKPRTNCNYPNITITGENALSENESTLSGHENALSDNENALSENENALLVNGNAPLETENVLLQKLYTLGECSRLRTENDCTDKLRTVLYDLEEVEEFLEYCSGELLSMMSHFSAVEKILRFLSVEAEYIEIVLQNVQLKYLAEKDGKLSYEEREAKAGTYNVIQHFGHNLLDSIIESGKMWGPAIEQYKSNFAIVSGTVFKFCSTSIESILVNEPNLVYDVLKEVKRQVEQAQAIQGQVMTLYQTQSSQIANIRECINEFKRLSNSISF